MCTKCVPIQNIQFKKDTTGENVDDLGYDDDLVYDNDLLDTIPKALSMKQIIAELSFIKIKKSSVKYDVNRMRRLTKH